MPAATRPASNATRVLLLLCGTLACFGAGRVEEPEDGTGPPPLQPLAPGLASSLAAYGQAGLLASAGPLPFVGSVRYLAGPSPDSTLLLVTLSLTNRALTFASEGEGRRGAYGVSVELRNDGKLVQRSEAHEVVRVASFRESARNDESIIFQQFIPVAPGNYLLAVAVKDEGSARTASHELYISVPRLVQRTLSSPITVYEGVPRTSADSLPRLVPNPRATVVFGRDSVVPVYLEGYGLEPQDTVFVGAFTEKSVPLWGDTIPLPAAGSLHAAVLDLPVSTVGVGRLTVAATLLGSGDTVRTPLFVSFGEEWAVASFDEMLSYLRYFVSPERLQELRDASLPARPNSWITFLKETDPNTRTPEHEGLQAYFARLQGANERFRDEGVAGWLTDRGMVFVTLGEPDQIVAQGDVGMTRRGRAQV